MTRVIQSIEKTPEEGHPKATNNGAFTPPRRRSTFSPAAYRDLHNVSPSPDAPRRARTFGVDIVNDSLSETFAEFGVGPAMVQTDRLADRLAGLRVDGPMNSSNEPIDYASSVITEEDDNYSVRSEPLPEAPIYDKALQGVLREAKINLQTLERTMQTCPLRQDNTTTFASLADQTKRLASFEYPKTRVVGFVGDSGAGKSSLINSLLNENLAKSSGDGGACTNIVTEYQYLPSTKEGLYKLEVEYMTLQEVTDLLEELLSDYRAYYTDSFKEVKGVEDRKAVKSRGEKAYSMLDALFGDQISPEVLSDPESDASSTILPKLESCALDILRHRPGGLDDDVWSTIADDEDDLIDKIDPFIRDSSEGGLYVIWPFVKIIRIHLHSEVLVNGLVLADLPGLKDLNYARVRATERYMRNCHEVFAVTTIYRATSDVAIKDIVSRCGNHRPLRIVCTRSEDVNARETERSSNSEEAESIRTLRTKVKEVKSDLKTTREARRKGTSSAESNERELNLQDRLAEAEFQLKKFLVERRNAKVTNQLQQQYAESVLNNDLRVWCVSNVDYEKFKEEGPPINELQRDLSGIIALRSHCQLIPAEAQFKAVTAFLEHQIPSLLGSLRQWAQQGTDTVAVQNAEALNQVLKSCAESFEQWHGIPRMLKFDLKDGFRTSVQHEIVQNNHAWMCDGIETCQKWNCLHSSTYSAFCRNYGDHSTQAAGYRNWNAELLQPAIQSMSAVWQQYEEAVTGHFNAMLVKICSIFDSETSKLTESNRLAPNTIRTLISNLVLHHYCIKDLVADISEQMLEKSRNIQSNATGAHSSSYIVNQMIPAYKACNLESGTGSDKRRKTHIEQHISRTSFFNGFSKAIKEAIWEDINTVAKSLEDEMSMVFEPLIRDIRGSVLPKGEPSESQRFPGTLQAVERMLEEMNDLVDQSRRIISRLQG